MNIDNLREPFEICLRQAGSLALSYYKLPVTLIPKKQGFCTQADLAVEQFLLQQLGVLLPGTAFCAEESGLSGDQQSDYCWVIDPLDGTTNFAHAIPYFCISVALTYQGKPILGGIYQPVLDEFFYGAYGAGAWFNGTRIAPRSQAVGVKLLVASAWSTRKPIGRLRGYTVRYFGAAALDCAYLACGKLDGLMFDRAAWWDIAAGILLLQEAGVPVSYAKRIINGQERYKVTAGYDALL